LTRPPGKVLLGDRQHFGLLPQSLSSPPPQLKADFVQQLVTHANSLVAPHAGVKHPLQRDHGPPQSIGREENADLSSVAASSMAEKPDTKRIRTNKTPDPFLNKDMTETYPGTHF
jgi:hypothetical protein